MKLKILIIDDEPRWIKFAQSNPELLEIEAVADAKAALAKLKTGQFDLVIASSRQLDALDIVRQKYADKPMVITTTAPTSQEERHAYRLGARRYFAKSFNYSDLLEQIKEVVPSGT